jgi:hypothetical protein
MNLIDKIQYANDLPAKKPLLFLELMQKHIDLPTLIQPSFYLAYNSSETNHRTYPLESMLAVALLMHFFKFASAANFITLLALSPDVRAFCRLPDGCVPDESLMSKFKIAFDNELRLFFENVSLHVMDIFTDYDAALPVCSPQKGLNETCIFDTGGLKPKVRENNPKTLATEIRRQTAYKKHLDRSGSGKGFNPYMAAYANLPKAASANPSVRLDYANGHFGYFYRFGMVTNGFGVPLHIHFYDDDFYNGLPNDFRSAAEQKYAYDNASLFPALSSLFKRIGNNRFSTFIADSEFDSHDNYGFLNELGFSKVLIPINERNSRLSDHPIPVDASGIPRCPKDPFRPFIPAGICKGRNRSLRFKFVCPESRLAKARWVCGCPDKCRPTNSTVTSYAYPSGDLRTFFGVRRGSKEWVDTYKTRTAIEREFSSMKSHPALERPNTYNCASMRADVYLNAASKLITVMLAFALGKPDFMRNINKLLKSA